MVPWFCPLLYGLYITLFLEFCPNLRWWWDCIAGPVTALISWLWLIQRRLACWASGNYASSTALGPCWSQRRWRLRWPVQEACATSGLWELRGSFLSNRQQENEGAGLRKHRKQNSTKKTHSIWKRTLSSRKQGNSVATLISGFWGPERGA